MPASISTQRAVRAADFQRSIGVNTHTGSWDAAYGLLGGGGGDVGKVSAELSFLGVHGIRDTLEYSWQLPEYQQLAAQGVKFNLFIGAGNQANSVAAQVADIAKLAPNVLSVEGPNETDNWPIQVAGLSGPAATRAAQAQLYADVHGTTALAGVPVVETTVGNSASMLAALSGLGNADLGNSHSYFFSYSQTIASQIASRVAQANSIAPGKQVITTEAGWSSAASASDYGSVDQATQAKLTLDMLLDQFQAGVPMTYLYQLNDEAEVSDSFGLFNQDGTAKPVATAIHNLTAILADSAATSASFTPASLAYLVSGLPATGSTMLMQKSSGVFDLVVWSEPQNWNPALRTEIAVPATTVTITLAAVAQSVKVYDPLLGTTAISTFANTTTIQLPVADHPLIVEIVPAPIPVPATTDTIILDVSEDGFQGDAQFSVSVDGVQSGGVRTATAAHAKGQTQAFTLNGQFGSGAHIVKVTFLNDAYGGPGLDRNLYVDALTFDGGASAGTASLFSNGSATLAVAPPAATGQTPAIPPGLDTLVLTMSEDRYDGDAAFSVKIDGVALGGTQLVTASHALGESQTFSFTGSFGVGSHDVKIAFLNDAYGGVGADRNLYVNSARLDDGPSVGPAALYANGQVDLQISPLAVLAPRPASLDASDTLVLNLSEDRFDGDAAFLVSIDGVQQSGSRSITALHAMGQSQAFTFTGNFGPGLHAVDVRFLNDAYAGPGQDRNLYVGSASFDGHAATVGIPLYTNGTAHFQVGIATA